MLRIDLPNAKSGMKLRINVEHPRQRGYTLLKAGFELNESSIHRLRELGVRCVWVAYPSLDFLGEYVDEKALASQRKVVDNICDCFKTAEKGAVAGMSYDTYTKSIGQLIASLVENPKAALFLDNMLDDGGDDLMRHSGAVTHVSVLMGLKLAGYLTKEHKHTQPGRAGEVINLGVGAMLHDIGVTQLDEEVRQQFRQNGNDCNPKWQMHPSVGYDMVRGRIEPSAATIVLNHHQRMDGTTYAGGNRPALEGRRIHVFARIVALANRFDRFCHPIGSEAICPAVFALSQLVTEPLLSQFDRQALRALLAVVPRIR